MSNNIKHIDIAQAKVKAIKADFVKNEITLSLTMHLNEHTLALREDLSFIAFMEQPVKVQIDSLQREMDFKEAFMKAAQETTGVQIIDDSTIKMDGDTTIKVTGPSKGKRGK